MSLLLAGTTACSGDDPAADDPGAAGTTSVASTSPTAGQSSGPTTEPTTGPTASRKPPASARPLPTLNADQVLAGLTRAGYRCDDDSTYAQCTSGPAVVWVLTGKHNRPPVISVHATGSADKAVAAIKKALPRVLVVAHINERAELLDWVGGQSGQPAGQTTIGDWQVDLSAEVDTDEPGAHLTLMDKLCKSNCEAE